MSFKVLPYRESPVTYFTHCFSQRLAGTYYFRRSEWLHRRKSCTTAPRARCPYADQNSAGRPFLGAAGRARAVHLAYSKTPPKYNRDTKLARQKFGENARRGASSLCVFRQYTYVRPGRCGRPVKAGLGLQAAEIYYFWGAGGEDRTKGRRN